MKYPLFLLNIFFFFTSSSAPPFSALPLLHHLLSLSSYWFFPFVNTPPLMLSSLSLHLEFPLFLVHVLTRVAARCSFMFRSSHLVFGNYVCCLKCQAFFPKGQAHPSPRTPCIPTVFFFLFRPSVCSGLTK